MNGSAGLDGCRGSRDRYENCSTEVSCQKSFLIKTKKKSFNHKS